ncbi:PTS fructose transporter subunit IIC [Erysipelothrix larvae]|uniref:PTS fructose transporter subunit IIC n=1 Tax=Erysipelothrix larvae TaxID=1514105 RepID=A0A0X8H0T0_9FIRM|nr:PTS fructose transporter subunit IIC [Erysipelothrix larvae]AMC93985.1 PTS fructose transporter subunit IIC [Erysipelothrix larvae]
MATITRKNNKKVSQGEKIKASFLTGTSYMIPVIVAGGIIMAIAKAIGGYDVANNPGTFAYLINQIGASAFFFSVPILTAAIAYSIGDRPAIGPALAIGYLSNEINAGFVGGLIGGFLVGYMVLAFKKLKVPNWATGIMPILVIPVTVTLAVGCIFQFIIGEPIAFVMNAMVNWLASLQGGSKFILGAVMGTCWGIDFGGPFTKTAASFANGLNADGVYGPTSVKMAAGMAPPLGMALAVLLARKKFTQADIENAKVAVPLSMCYITEGAIPFYLNDPIRVWCSTIPGSAVAGGLALMWGVESPALHGGIFVVPMMNNPLVFLTCLGIGTIITGVIYAIIKKPLTEEAALD